MSLTLMSPFPYTRSLVRNSRNESEIPCCFQVGAGCILTLRSRDMRNPFCSHSVPHVSATPGVQGAAVARDAKAEMHRLRIFPVFVKKGQNYSSGSLVWFVVLSCHTSHRQEKERACVSWMGSCHPCLASKNHPLRVIDRVNSTRFTKPSFETSRSCATIPSLPPRARPLVGASRPSAGAPLGLAGPSGGSTSPKLHHGRETAKDKVYLRC